MACCLADATSVSNLSHFPQVVEALKRYSQPQAVPTVCVSSGCIALGHVEDLRLETLYSEPQAL